MSPWSMASGSRPRCATVIDLAPEVTPSHLAEMVQDCLGRRLFTVEEAFRRIAEPDMVGRKGADLTASSVARCCMKSRHR